MTKYFSKICLALPDYFKNFSRRQSVLKLCRKKIQKKEGVDLTFSRLVLLPFFQTAFEVPFSFIIFRSGEGKASAGCEAKVREGKFAFKFSSFFAVEEEENRARGFFFQTKRQILFSFWRCNCPIEKRILYRQTGQKESPYAVHVPVPARDVSSMRTLKLKSAPLPNFSTCQRNVFL